MDTISSISENTMNRSESGLLESQPNQLLDRYLNRQYISELMDSVFQHYLFLSETDATAHVHFQLGYMYHHGFGSVTKNLNKAFYHYQLSADLCHPAAQYMLYKLYGSDPSKSNSYVRIVSEDELVDLKVRMYIKSAAQDNHYCKANLTLWKAYRKSQLWHDIINRAVTRYKQVIADVTEGRIHMEKNRLAETYNELGYLTVQLNLNNNPSVYRRAMEYFTTARESGNAAAYFNVGCMMYHNSFGVERDELKIQEYCLQAAERLHPRALYILARQKLNPRVGCEEDCKQAFYYLKQSLQYRYSSTLLELGYVYLMGIAGQTRNSNLARQFFEEATVAFDYTDSLGNIRAFHVLGYMYERGLGCDIDYMRAACYYAYAARKQNFESYCKLAKLIEKKRVPHNHISDAILLYQMAIESSHHAVGYANYRLGKLYSKLESPQYDERLACRHFVDAFRYYDEAVRQNELTAGQCYHIGVMYQFGYGIETDVGKAVDYFRMAMNCAGLTYNILDKWYGKKAKRRYDNYLSNNGEGQIPDDRKSEHGENSCIQSNASVFSAFANAAELRQSLNDLDGFHIDPNKGGHLEQVELLPMLSSYDQCENVATDPSEIPSLLDEMLTKEFQCLAADNLQVKDVFLEGYIQLLKEEIAAMSNKQQTFDSPIENLKKNLTNTEREASQELARLIAESAEHAKMKKGKIKKVQSIQHIRNYSPLFTFYHSARICLIKDLLTPSLEKVDTSGEMFLEPIFTTAMKSISNQLLLNNDANDTGLCASSDNSLTRLGLQRVEKIADKIARVLTICYENQLLCVTSCGAKLLGQCAIKFIEYNLPLFYDFQQLPTAKAELDEWIINAFVQSITTPHGADEQALSICNRKIPCVVMGMDWTVYGVFKKPGVITTDGDYFTNSNSDPVKYGYRYGSIKEVEKLKMTQQRKNVVSQNGDSSGNGMISGTVDEISNSRILSRDNEVLRHQVTELDAEVKNLKKMIFGSNGNDTIAHLPSKHDETLQSLVHQVEMLNKDIAVLKKILITRISSSPPQDVADLIKELALTRSDTTETLSGEITCKSPNGSGNEVHDIGEAPGTADVEDSETEVLMV